MPCANRPGFLRDCLSTWGAATNGVTPKTHAAREKYWRHWSLYAATTGINQFLEKSVPPMERDIIAGAFAARVRTGSYGWGNQIKVAGVTGALVAISKTIELAGQPSQLYRSDQKYQLFIKIFVEGFRRA